MNTCPKCGEPVSGGQRYCSGCGADLSASWVATELGDPSGDRTGPSPSSTYSSATESARFAPGDVLEDRYRVIAQLGRGGMGEVYRADDLKIGQSVALKLLPEEMAGDPDRNQLFLNEVRLGLKVTHPNVCRLFDIVDSDGFQFLSMEYVDGEDLASLLRRIGRLPGDKAVEIAQQLCAGLAAAHDVGVLHRDLKPANVMVDGRGRAKITDFGLAGATRGIEGPQARVGTPGYMAPEQLEGGELDERTDIYALGLVLYELFTGRRAFEAGSSAEMLQLQRESTPSDLSSHVAGLDPAVERAILRCLEPLPQRRPASAASVAAALPGGDPLAAAIAAGETPSPEMVADAGEVGALRPITAWASLAACAIVITMLVMFFGRTQITDHAPMTKEPAVLVSEARAILNEIGLSGNPADSSWGFQGNWEFVSDLDESEDPARWQQLGSGPDSAVLFWYRQSPSPLRPVNPSSRRASPSDPATDQPGMCIIWLDTEGRLVRLEAVPPDRPAAVEKISGADWSFLIAAAGIDRKELDEVEPQWRPPFYSDEWLAWMTETHEGEESGLRIEGASFEGRPTWFRVISPWEDSAVKNQRPMSGGNRIVNVIFALISLSVMLGGLLLALRNVRLGRGDLRGAFRITAVFVVLHTVGWALWTRHVWTTQAFLASFVLNLATAVFEGLTLYMLYLAVEPFVRRRWPDAIISWNRLIAGRFRDPLIGRDLLFGSLIGGIVTLLIYAEWSMPGWLGQAPARPRYALLSPFNGVRGVVGEVLDSVIHSMTGPMLALVMFVLLLVLFRRTWAAVLAILLVAPTLAVIGGADWITAVFVIGYASLMLVTVVRFGLLAAVVGQAVINVFLDHPITADLGSWWAGATVAAVSLVAVMAGYGFLTSLGGRSPFGEGLLED